MLKDVPGMLGIVLSDREGIPIVRSVWVVNLLARRVIRGRGVKLGNTQT